MGKRGGKKCYYLFVDKLLKGGKEIGENLDDQEQEGLCGGRTECNPRELAR